MTPRDLAGCATRSPEWPRPAHPGVATAVAGVVMGLVYTVSTDGDRSRLFRDRGSPRPSHSRQTRGQATDQGSGQTAADQGLPTYLAN
jgi:hypothetical protein